MSNSSLNRWSGKTMLVMAGGTGGHIYPAMACANEVIKQGGQVVWLGTKKGLESEIVPKSGIPIEYIDIAGLRGNGLLGWLKAPFRIMKAIGQASQVIARVKPDVVLGMGGFVTGPGGVAAKAKGVPLVIHEQNAIPGMTNKLLARISDRVLEAFPNTFAHANDTTGNPVRSDLNELPAPEQRKVGQREVVHVLVVGGSLGAVAINNMVPVALERLRKQGVQFTVVHQCGRKNVEQTEAAYKETSVDVSVQPFIEDMARAYRDADLVICRSGALTVSELMNVGVPSVLVPFPFAVDDHQTANAKYLEEVQAGIICQQEEMDPEQLSQLLADLIQNNKLPVMANNAWQSRKIDATERVLSHCQELVNV
ncbi:undecaprenyldiphospho-muramoylpentapeptide beta-N-acetylglucosaminyltransferase [Litoribrevibacter albus]|uniref:UDP-N-acetylglucosamine--N-acetylmuramyl-(pentapeptide) pyrophosphoryl-undecaprenol N-acetylglucosamine transferase n=1 Tax=Litoribrevibacter albus TaxID=1473156 RepID=A0AA37SCB5_9GAMM|nr:undecaprenyldiphospho-muramoylpentapeptide beta-N-acetylglucosaminyltransferase [Litoribrevibacter albus]GLQ33255.1 UDP-N-acetylglucosamine--N-acetylmuramyl-(pentapeptide) pyrophosphoryl-undecaprenol N-acetylglucosamine transferase [Litoribrevibacter albus]